MKFNGLMLLMNNYEIIILLILLIILFLVIWNKLDVTENSQADHQNDNIKYELSNFISRMDITSAQIGAIIIIGLMIVVFLTARMLD